MRTRSRLWIALLCVVLIGHTAAAQRRAGTSRQRSRSRRSNQPKQANAARDQFYAVFHEGKKVGFIRYSRVAKGKTVSTNFEIDVTLPHGKSTRKFSQSEGQDETREGKPMEFRFNRDNGAESLMGKVTKGNRVTITYSAGGASMSQRKSLPTGALTREGVRRIALQKGLAQGTKYAVTRLHLPMFDAVPHEFEVGPTGPVEVMDSTVTLTKITDTFKTAEGEQKTVTYVDKDLFPLKFELHISGKDLVAMACGRVYAESGDWTESVTEALMKCPTSLAGAADAKAIKFHVRMKRNVSRAGLTGGLAETSSQTLERNRGLTTITVQRLAPAGGTQFPYKGRDTAARLAVRPRSVLDSKDPGVVALAQQAVGGSNDAAAGTRAIEAFVRDYVKDNKYSAHYVRASKVVQDKAGDCKHRAILAAAMCQAVGIPARLVWGAAYADEFEGQKQVFVVHFWAEAFDGTNWIGLDPDKTGWDPRRIAIFAGNPSLRDLPILFDVLKRYQIEKVEVVK